MTALFGGDSYFSLPEPERTALMTPKKSRRSVASYNSAKRAVRFDSASCAQRKNGRVKLAEWNQIICIQIHFSSTFTWSDPEEFLFCSHFRKKVSSTFFQSTHQIKSSTMDQWGLPRFWREVGLWILRIPVRGIEPAIFHLQDNCRVFCEKNPFDSRANRNKLPRR